MLFISRHVPVTLFTLLSHMSALLPLLLPTVNESFLAVYA